MQLLITGGTGSIGSRLVESLAADHHEIIVLSRNPAAHKFPEGVSGVAWDGKTPDGWGHLVDGIDVVINLAGENLAGNGTIPSRWTDARKKSIRESRINAGQALVDAIRAADVKPKLLFQISGIDYYPPGDDLVTETSPPGDTFLANVVANDWEPSTAAVEGMGVRRIVGRLGPVLSMDGGPLPISVLQFKFFVGGHLGNGRQWLSWIHIDDAVNAIKHMCSSTHVEGVYNIVAPNPVRNEKFSQVLGSVTGRPKWIPAPAFALKLALGEISTLVLEGRQVSAQLLLDTQFKFKFAELKPALENLLE